ncbi:MAG: hypothetical protein JWR14_6092 [Caballeronia sp.]|jgi:hypothetical protein|nr:hypothetical protein [Caballeronia sp.]
MQKCHLSASNHTSFVENATSASRISVVCAKTPAFLAGRPHSYAKTPPLRILRSSVIGRIAERLSLADNTGSTKASEDNIREYWSERANGPNGQGRVLRAPNWPPLRQPNHANVTEAALPRCYSERHCDDVLFYQE